MNGDINLIAYDLPAWMIKTLNTKVSFQIEVSTEPQKCCF